MEVLDNSLKFQKSSKTKKKEKKKSSKTPKIIKCFFKNY